MIRIPTRSECFNLIEEHKVMPHIREHCSKVAEVALFIGRRLATAGIMLNFQLIEAGSLLHDIAKVKALNRGENHAEIGATLLEEHGFPLVAEIIRQHIQISDSVLETRITETEVVNYSDKRVLDTTVVSLKARFDYIRAKYGYNDEKRLQRINDNEKKTMELEGKIFCNLTIAPEDVPG